MLLMIGTILGPGTIFMMMTGAFNAAFKVPIMDAFVMNLVPLLLFMLVCYFMDSKIQLKFAEILTAIYAMVMMAVVVGTALQLQSDGVDSPSGIFFLCMSASFILAGLLHPQELYCLPRGIVYYLTVPSMYLLLIIYSVFNLNNVSWGTREVAKVLSKDVRTTKI
jgi:chitin synthase